MSQEVSNTIEANYLKQDYLKNVKQNELKSTLKIEYKSHVTLDL